MMRIHITTMGCPKNMVDSRHLLDKFMAEGFGHAEGPSEADIVLINTCGFIKDATEESISEILDLVQFCDKKRDARLIVFGCLAKRYAKELLKEIPEIDAIFGVGEDEKIIEYCRGVEALKRGSAEAGAEKSKEKKEQKHGAGTYLKSKSGQAKASKVNDIHATQLPGASASFAYLKIAEGCDKKCTFCVIPSIRGRFRSIKPEEIIKEASRFVKAGVKELILVAQDITQYGKEWGDYGLINLLKDMAAIKGDFRIRLLYLYPTEITNELLDFISEEEKICKYLDIPLQHTEDRILRLMGRRGSRNEYVKLLRTIRRRIVGVTLRTTFIVGFPTETEAEFHGMVDFIEEARFDRLGVFMYSDEEGSPAALLKGQVPDEIRQRRLDEIMTRQAEISLEKNRTLAGQRFRAIVEELDDEVIICRLESQTPEIDGVVIIDDLRLKSADLKSEVDNHKSSIANRKSSMPKAGDFVEVEIVDAYEHDLKGRIVMAE